MFGGARPLFHAGGWCLQRDGERDLQSAAVGACAIANFVGAGRPRSVARVRRWRRKRGQPGVSALTSATPLLLPLFRCAAPAHTLRNAYRRLRYRDWSSTHACLRRWNQSQSHIKPRAFTWPPLRSLARPPANTRIRR